MDYIERAIYMLEVAAEYIGKYGDVSETVLYDGAECDGLCIIDDCKAAAEELKRTRESDNAE